MSDGTNRPRWPVVLAVFAFAFVAWYFACIVNAEREHVADDAFITYVYARNLAEGHGLRYNATDAAPTSGASSLLHVAIASCGIAAGLDPLALTRALGIAGLLACALAFGLLASRFASIPRSYGALAGVAVIFLWGLLPETALHFSSGMDTLLVTTLHGLAVAWAAWVASDERRPLGVPRALLGVAVLASLALARPEGTLLAILYLAAIAFVRRPRGDLASGALALLPVAIPLAVFVVAVAAWRASYFGDVAGNAYYVKVSNAIFGSNGALLPGADTTVRFFAFRIAPLAVLLFAFAAAVRVPNEGVRRAFWLLLPGVAIVLLYSRAIHEMAGGFRYEFPMLAPFALALVASVCWLAKRSLASFAGTLACGAIALPLLCATTSPDLAVWLAHPRSSSTLWLPRYVPRGNALARLGLDLADSGLEQRATILLSGAGQVAYYSRFRAVDWIGLNHSKLSGREPMTIAEMWSYLDSLQPDLAFSILPPAAPGSTSRDEDANFRSEHVQRTLSGRGSALFHYWNHERLEESFWREMLWLRDRCEYAACYQLGSSWGDDWWVLVYVRRDSPLRVKLLETFAASKRPDRDADLSHAFPYDPRSLVAQ